MNDLYIIEGTVTNLVGAKKTYHSLIVGDYAERHAKGQTNILFLRRASEPDKPFYTVEVSNDGIIRQCYGYKNNRAKNPKPDEIKAFEAQYQNYLNMEVMKHERTQRKLQQSA